MKKLLSFIVCILCISLFCACDTPSNKQVTVNLDLNGGEIVGESVYTATVGENLTLPVPTKTGYTFNGWTYNGEAVNLTPFNLELESVTLKAKWNPIQVNYTFNLLGGSGDFSDGSISYGESTDSIKALIPEYENANFVGWQVNGQPLGDVWTYLPENNQTVTLVAVYEKYFVLTFVNFDASEEYLSVNEDNGVNLDELPIPKTIKGYSASWELSDNEIYLLTEATVINAVLTPNKYTVIFKNGTLTETNNYVYDQTYTLPTKAREGYTFLGWSTSQDGSSGVIKGEYKWDFDRVITLFAIYEEKTYNVNYDTSNIKVDFELVNEENEVVSGSQQVTFSKPYNLYTVKTKNGVASVVWEYNGAQLSASGNWNIATDVKLTAKIVVNEVEIAVKVDVNGGSGEEDCTLILTKPLSSLTQMPTAPTGKRLVGFNYKGTFYSLSDVFNHYDYDGTPLVAVYGDRVFITVNVDVNGGTGESTATVELGEKLSSMQNKPKAPTGKKLVGFYYKDTFYDLNAVFDVEDYDGEVLTAHYVNDDEDWSPLG